jgi:hypothetical protein
MTDQKSRQGDLSRERDRQGMPGGPDQGDRASAGVPEKNTKNGT